ncbi:hypothetical protein [Mesorhizobium qingshengii]|uniref:Uncharacterized protein n=1 Tax=Mesorhizobium qingshengii TaxID=1165689 RepID=A0A1G5Z2K6_9HYPH|nr:hypothetical protein [Mesorhizobium qingshengii]SDA89088.1 hypothetical protein SAMN02927914_04122 [Mesorhizobium qingshengii]
MRYDYSALLRDDVTSTVHRAFKTAGIVNITTVAEQVRVRNLAENVALEDIEHLVLQAAQLIGAAIEFDGLGSDFPPLGDGLVEDGDEHATGPLDFPQPTSIQ